MSEWQPLEAGTVVRDRYEVEALLGKGGFGATYRARDRERFGQPCALKELLPARATNPKVLEAEVVRLLRDALTILQHLHGRCTRGDPPRPRAEQHHPRHSRAVAERSWSTGRTR